MVSVVSCGLGDQLNSDVSMHISSDYNAAHVIHKAVIEELSTMYETQDIMSALTNVVEDPRPSVAPQHDLFEDACRAAGLALSHAFSEELGELYIVSIFCREENWPCDDNDGPLALRQLGLDNATSGGVEVMLNRVPASFQEASPKMRAALLTHLVGDVISSEVFKEPKEQAAMRFHRILRDVNNMTAH
jgi:hypothetical protein